MNTVFYFLRETYANLRRSKLLTTVSVLTTGVLLFFLLALSLIMLNIHLWISGENQTQISVYFDTRISLVEERKIADSIIYNIAANASARFISRDKSFEIFQSIYGSEMLTAIEGNPFPALLELAFGQDVSNEKIDSISQIIGSLQGVETVIFSHDWFEEVRNFRNSVSNGLFALATVMVLVVFFTIMNTIKLTVYAREDIISNMQYVGASGWYIKTPFILEGIVQGTLGGLIAVAAIFPMRFIIPDFDIYWGGAQILAGVVIFGAILGFFGSSFAVKKFIKI
ncbi:MAG: ABC transporter permease [Chitinivibrionia bacterium]|nr:ABC transporter permease [Chitinivibrionia bacterium]